MYPEASGAGSTSIHPSWADRLKRAGLLAAMSVLTLNVFTGSPLMALWLGSRVQGSGPPTMEAFFTFLCTLAAGSFVLVKLIAAAGRAHDELVGRQPTVRTHLPWLRSLRGERPHEAGAKVGLSALDVILVIAVMLAVVAFEIWFFFYSSSPIDERSGRS
jgi:hypothetical protein